MLMAFFAGFFHQHFLTLSTKQKEVKKMQKRWLEHFCKYRHICEFLGNEETEARELLSDPKNNFTIRIGNRLYAHKGRLDTWLLNQILQMENVAFMQLRYIPNDTLKWLKNSRFYGSIDEIFDVSLSKLQPRKEAQMGKSLNVKEIKMAYKPITRGG